MPSVLPMPGPRPVGLGKPLPPQPQVQVYDITDPAQVRTRIFDQVLSAAQKLPPRSHARHTLQLKDVDYDEEREYDLEKQKEAILSNKTLGRRLVGTWQLLDNATGKTLDE